jgi:hypothetical protein
LLGDGPADPGRALFSTANGNVRGTVTDWILWGQLPEGDVAVHIGASLIALSPVSFPRADLDVPLAQVDRIDKRGKTADAPASKPLSAGGNVDQR